MKKYLLLAALLMSSTAFAKVSKFACVSGTESGDMVSLNGCIDEATSKLVACKDQDKKHLGYPYVSVEKSEYSRGRVVTPPVRDIVEIPAMYMSAQVSKENFEFSMNEPKAGVLDLKISGEERRFNLQVKGIQHQLTAVVCNYLK